MVRVDTRSIVATLGEASLIMGRPANFMAIRKHRWRYRGVAFPEPYGRRNGKPTYLVRELEAWVKEARAAPRPPEERAYHAKYATHATRVEWNEIQREKRRAQDEAQLINKRLDDWTRAAG